MGEKARSWVPVRTANRFAEQFSAGFGVVSARIEKDSLVSQPLPEDACLREAIPLNNALARDLTSGIPGTLAANVLLALYL